MNSIKGNYLYSSFYQILSIILPLIVAPYIARVLGAEGVGTYSYYFAVANYFLLFSMLGYNNYGNRSIAKVRKDKDKLSETFFEIYIIQIMTSLIIIILYVFFLNKISNKTNLIAYILILYLLSATFDINWFFFGLEKFKLTVTRNLIIKIFTVFLIFTLVKNKDDLWKYTLIMTLSTLVSNLFLLPFLKQYILLKKVDFKKITKHFKPILIMFLPVIAYSIYKIMDKVMLGNISTHIEVGYYENAEKITMIPLGLITSLGNVMLPRMSFLVATGQKEKSKNYTDFSLIFVTVLASAMVFGILGISDIFVPIFLGNEFYPSIKVVNILTIMVFFTSWASVVRTQYLLPHYKDKEYVIPMFIGAILNLIINIILIPKYQATGAAIGTIVAEASVMIMQAILIRKDYNVLKPIKKAFSSILIGFTMFLIIKSVGYILNPSILTLLIQIIIGTIYYITIYILVEFKKQSDISKYLKTTINTFIKR